jgi:hypothetical protein
VGLPKAAASASAKRVDRSPGGGSNSNSDDDDKVRPTCRVCMVRVAAAAVVPVNLVLGLGNVDRNAPHGVARRLAAAVLGAARARLPRPWASADVAKRLAPLPVARKRPSRWPRSRPRSHCNEGGWGDLCLLTFV